MSDRAARQRHRDRARDVLTVLAAVALLAAAWFGWTWWSAAQDEELSLARERDRVVAEVSAALVALNTIDHRSAERDVDRWIAATAGQLHDDLSGERQLQLDRTAGTRTVAEASLLTAAVTEPDAEAGSARLVAVLDVVVSTAGEEATSPRSRLTVDAERTTGGLKVSAVQATG
jgi:Mce-associated membrane protein